MSKPPLSTVKRKVGDTFVYTKEMNDRAAKSYDDYGLNHPEYVGRTCTILAIDYNRELGYYYDTDTCGYLFTFYIDK